MDTITILKQSFLFSGISEETIGNILKQSPPRLLIFKRGELVYSSSNEENMVGIILSGRCEIRLERSSKSKTVLNILCESDSFGVLSVYSADEFPTQIYATKNSDILVFTAEQIREFANNYSQISANIIKFLANRISFLNKKIVTFSGCRVEDRLAVFLLCESERYKAPIFPFNCNKTSEEINAGRASVYRAISSLEADGFILLSDKTIQIIDPQGLERITK